VGRALYATVLDELPRRGFRCAMGGIALPNAPSVALHESMGFAKVAHFADVGFKFGQWIDVGYWQRTFA
jgi:phosphinothricin acetyltransferase